MAGREAAEGPTAQEMENLLKEGKIEQFKDVLNNEVYTNMENGQASRLLRQLAQLNEGDVKANADLPVVELYGRVNFDFVDEGDWQKNTPPVDAISVQTDKTSYTVLDQLNDYEDTFLGSYGDFDAKRRYKLGGNKEFLPVFPDVPVTDYEKITDLDDK